MPVVDLRRSAMPWWRWGNSWGWMVLGGCFFFTQQARCSITKQPGTIYDTRTLGGGWNIFHLYLNHRVHHNHLNHLVDMRKIDRLAFVPWSRARVSGNRLRGWFRKWIYGKPLWLEDGWMIGGWWWVEIFGIFTHLAKWFDFELFTHRFQLGLETTN